MTWKSLCQSFLRVSSVVLPPLILLPVPSSDWRKLPETVENISKVYQFGSFESKTQSILMNRNQKSAPIHSSEEGESYEWFCHRLKRLKEIFRSFVGRSNYVCDSWAKGNNNISSVFTLWLINWNSMLGCVDIRGSTFRGCWLWLETSGVQCFELLDTWDNMLSNPNILYITLSVITAIMIILWSLPQVFALNSRREIAMLSFLMTSFLFFFHKCFELFRQYP